MEIKESTMRCSVKGCGFSHYNGDKTKKVFAIGNEGYAPIIICEDCVKEMNRLVKDIKAERTPRVNGKTGEVKMVKKAQPGKKVESDD